MQKRVLGILGGGDTPLPMLKSWAEKADILIAADQGADRLLAAGGIPHIVLGDMDSIDPGFAAEGIELYKLECQSSSDCEKLLRFVEQAGHQALTIIGFEGDRLDHVLAGLAAFVGSTLGIRIVLRTGMGHLHRPGPCANYQADGGTAISIIPLQRCLGVTSRGLKWELAGATMEFGLAWSLSNEAVASDFDLSIDDGCALVVIEKSHDADAGW